jgi:glycosyltransferase involved in cell wall biosynthesis
MAPRIVGGVGIVSGGEAIKLMTLAPKKILFLADCLSNGGAERQLALLVKYMPLELDRRVFSLGDGPFAQVIRDAGVPLEICERRWRFDIRPAFMLWRVLSLWHPDVVHSWGWMGSFVAGPFCKIFGIRFVDGFIRMGRIDPRRECVGSWGMLWADRVIANSQAGLTSWKINVKKGRVIYNGFDPQRLPLCESVRSSVGKSFLVVMTGRMNEQKDYRTFFLAARELLKASDQNWHFTAVGNGRDRQTLMDQTQDLIAAGQVDFPDAGIEVLPIVRQADVGVLLSPYGEGCSNTILEYMACGLPVICNDNGGNRELVHDGKTGFLIPTGDTQTLVDKLLYLRNNPREAVQLGQAGKQRIQENFSVESMVQKTVQVYEELF